MALGLVAALAYLSGCGLNPFASAEAKPDDPSKAPAAVPVEVAPIARGRIETTLKSSTWIEVEEEVKVYSRAANRVAEVRVEEGDAVAKDQLLLRLEDDLQKTNLGKAQTRVEKARQEHARQEALFGQKLISEQAFNDIQFELRQAELALEDAQRELGYTEVRAPIAGTLTRRLVKYGDFVNPNQHLFDLMDFDSMVARVHIPEKDLPALALNQVVRVTSASLGDREFTGYVRRIAPVVEARTGLVKVTVGFKDIRELRPGMYVNVEIVTATRDDALLLSKRALVYDRDLRYVYRLLPERKVERLLIEAKLEDRFNLEPASGFQEGDQIVIAGQTGLKDGALVRLPTDPEPESPKDAQPRGANPAP